MVGIKDVVIIGAVGVGAYALWRMGSGIYSFMSDIGVPAVYDVYAGAAEAGAESGRLTSTWWANITGQVVNPAEMEARLLPAGAEPSTWLPVTEQTILGEITTGFVKKPATEWGDIVKIDGQFFRIDAVRYLGVPEDLVPKVRSGTWGPPATWRDWWLKEQPLWSPYINYIYSEAVK